MVERLNTQDFTILEDKSPDSKLIDASRSTILPDIFPIREEMPNKKLLAHKLIEPEDTPTTRGQRLVAKIKAVPKMLRMTLGPKKRKTKQALKEPALEIEFMKDPQSSSDSESDEDKLGEEMNAGDLSAE